MALHDVAVQTPVHQHRALEVHTVALTEFPEIRPLEGFLNGRHGVGAVGMDFNHREAHAVVRHRLVDAKLLRERAPHPELEIAALALGADHRGGFFYYS